jgi:ABC-type glycerol-3-phosphate transport system permease component
METRRVVRTHSSAGSSRAAARFRKRITTAVVFAVLTCLALVFAFPFFWMASTSLKDYAESRAFPPKLLPEKPLWSNYSEALKEMSFWLYLRNTCIITFLCLFGQLLAASLVAFGFARLHFPGRDTLFWVMLSTMMIPQIVTLVPIYKAYAYLKWLDTFYPLIVPAWFGGGAFNIFLFREFFKTIPMEYDDAARVDGGSSWQIYRHIIIPQSIPVIIVITIFTFVAHWNDFLGPFILLRNPANYTLALGLQAFQDTGTAAGNYPYLTAASLVILSPILVIFFFLQKYFIMGIKFSGLKG